MISVKLHVLLAVSAVLLFGAATASAQTGPFSFFAVAPCRVVDTRNPVSTNGGPVMGQGVTRTFAIRNNCGVPAGAAAVSLNVTVANATTGSFLTIWPAGITRPVVSTINFTQNDPSLANGAIVALGAGSPDLSVFNSGGSVHVIIDITGFFQ
jgi:serine protease